MWVVEQYSLGNLVAIHPGLDMAPWSSRANAVSFLESKGVDTTQGRVDSYLYPPAPSTAHYESHMRYSGGVDVLQVVEYTDGSGTGWVLREISVHQRREQLGLDDERAGLQEREMSWAGLDEKLAEEDGL